METPGSRLQQLARRASEHDINLNDRVDRDESFRPLYRDHAIIYRGTINSERTWIAIRSLRPSPSADNAAGDVYAPHCYNIRPPN